jgi:demethylmenaquinone methyltransferase/2-methoxy-6-polyprenyl-1,4-benzoquinol methylase
MNLAKAAFFDAQVGSPWAADEYGPAEAPKIRRLLAEADFRSGLSVLEPGWGTGRLTEVLADAVDPGGRIEALEISARMVEVCRRRLGRRTNVVVHHTALEEYQRSAESFDRIICHQVFPHFDDKPAAVARMVQLLRPSGLLIIVHFINAVEINDVHRKAGTIVEGDLMPPQDEMERLFRRADLAIDLFSDDALGYFLRAVRLDGAECTR